MRIRLLPSVALLASILLAGEASAYVIYLKGGAQVTAREKPTVLGNFLVFYTPLGAMQRVPLSEYDEQKTLEMNAQGTGDAYVLGNAPQDKTPDSGAKKASLSEYLKTQKKSAIGEERKPVEVAREGKAGKAAEAPAALDPQLEMAFLHTLETYGLKAPRVLAAPPGVRVQGLAETEDQVFAALKGIAKAMVDSRPTAHPVPKADIYLSTSTGESAGHYEMTGQDADALVGGKQTTVAWFMANVSL